MGKIGDLWVRLGLKKDEFSKGMNEAQKETEGFGNKMQGLKAGALAVWAAIGAAVAKFATDFVQSTQKFGDAWNQEMAGIKAAYQSFIATLSSGEGWRNLFSNMREASRLAKEAAAALDEVFERKTSFSYMEADYNRQIALQRQIMLNQSKSDAERKAAAEEIKRLEEELGAKKKEILQQESNGYKMQLQAKTKMTEEEIQYLVREWNANRDIILQAQEYNKAKGNLKAGTGFLAKAGGMYTQGNVAASAQALTELENSTDANIRKVAAMLDKYNLSNDEMIRKLAESEVRVMNVETEIINGSLRANTFLGRQGGGGGGGKTAKAEPLDRSSMQVDLSLTRDLTGALQGLAIAEKNLPDELKVPTFPEKDMSRTIDILQSWKDSMEQISEEFYSAITGGFANGVQTLTDGLMGLQDINGGAVMQALIEPLADLAIKAGEITMESGLALTALGKALTNPTAAAPAIAAGAALIAVGAAAKSGLASLASSMGGGGASSATTAASSSNSSVISEEIVVKVEGKISGNDILISGSRAKNSWNR